MPKNFDNDPLATFHLSSRALEVFDLKGPLKELKASPQDVPVPNFVREAVNRLKTPRQARLLLRLLRTYSPLGRAMPKDKLNMLVDRVLASEGLDAGDAIPSLTGVITLNDFTNFEANNTELVKELQSPLNTSPFQNPAIGEPFEVTRLKCDDAKRIFSFTVNCCQSCHDDWRYADEEPSEVRTREGTFYVCHSVAAAIKAQWQRD